MDCAAVSRHVRDRRPSAQFATGSDREDRRRGLVLPSQMFFAHFGCSEYRNKWRGCGGLLYLRTPLRFFALYQAHHAGDFKSKFTCRLDRLNCGRSRGTDIIHDHDARAILSKAFDSLSRAMLLLGFADEKTVDFAAGHGYGHHQWISPHG